MPDPKPLRVRRACCPDSRRSRRLQRLDLWLLGTILALLAPAVAAASSVPAPASGFVPVQVLCDGDCSGIPTPGAFPGGPLDYELAIRVPRVTGAPLDLSIVSKRNVVLLGPIESTGSIVLEGAQGVHIGSGAVITASEGAGITVETGGTVVIDDPGSPPIVAGPRPVGPPGSGPICACLSIGSGGDVTIQSAGGSISRVTGGRLRLSAPSLTVLEGELVDLRSISLESVLLAPASISLEGSLVLAAAIGGSPGAEPMPLRYAVNRHGDIYVDLSGVVLNSLNVVAGEGLYLEGPASMPAPEPGTALLIGLGLATLAGRRSAR